jgi:hypothetical protein
MTTPEGGREDHLAGFPGIGLVPAFTHRDKIVGRPKDAGDPQAGRRPHGADRVTSSYQPELAAQVSANSKARPDLQPPPVSKLLIHRHLIGTVRTGEAAGQESWMVEQLAPGSVEPDPGKLRSRLGWASGIHN